MTDPADSAHTTIAEDAIRSALIVARERPSARTRSPPR